MKPDEIINFLDKNRQDYLGIKSFSQLPGIYAIYFIGNKFPIFNHVEKNQIIYIGKTESSQESRDAKTHFANGKTGNSTVRKSIGSILHSVSSLNPIPRNDSDYQKGRFSHFQFEDKCEIKITDWMKSNLALSFFEYPKSKKEIETLEAILISGIVPVLNISKNPKNIYKAQLQNLRSACAAIAKSKTKKPEQPILASDNLPKTKTTKTSTQVYNHASFIMINNITENDFLTRQIRITLENKKLFPPEKKGAVLHYNFDFLYENENYEIKYSIGSKDGISRSGVLKLGKELFTRLKISPASKIKISKQGSGKYTIERI